MTAFRLAPVYNSRTIRVLHNDYLPRAVACLCTREDGGVDLVPIIFEGAPKPLTGREQPFDSLADALAFLGIPADAREEMAA